MMQRASVNQAVFLLGVLALMAGCSSTDPEAMVPDNIFGLLGEPLPAADAEQLATFERGRDVAIRRFAPTGEPGVAGLGPEFNVTFCGACHERPVFGGSAPRYRNFLLAGERVGSEFVAVTPELVGCPDEAPFQSSYLPAGKNGVQLHYDVENALRVPTATGNVEFAERNPIPFFGVGLLVEISEEAILANQDPCDEDGDGISGRPNFDRGFVGRLGRKAQTVSVEGFIRGPLFNHLGITSDPLSPERQALLPVPSDLASAGSRTEPLRGDIAARREAQAAAPDEPTIDGDGAPDPELSEQDLFDLISFSMLLAAPRPDEPTTETERGRASFEAANCSGCHVPTLESPRGLIPAFSDLLLHDMGADLADGVEAKLATGREFRTQPLWGVVATGPFLHDGRADSLDEAIRLHGGEASASRDAYVALSDDERNDLLAFLGSLGGRAQASTGLLPPAAPVPNAEEFGGALAGTDVDRFRRGRTRFDDDQSLATGLGPSFNGDSCRACHFDPVIGGAGPTDVDVTRQGIWEAGAFRNPTSGTMLHRHSTEPLRPTGDPEATFIELRQTPSIFGLGLVGRVTEATLLEFADPDDIDADGISGRPHRLSDGRLGRFGWKASVPSLGEFARDAMFNEMGVTLPSQPGFTFGAEADNDGVPDPEISVEDLEGLTFYLENLAPPPRGPIDAALEASGAVLFAQVTCDRCHRPTMLTDDGATVNAFSDFLLHAVIPATEPGIGDGDATAAEFRTSPLWGVRDTGPWMHDGRAFTLDEAIAHHAGEASGSRDAYMMLSGEDRALLLQYLESL